MRRRFGAVCTAACVLMSATAGAQASAPAPSSTAELEQRLAAQEARLQQQEARLRAQEKRLQEQEARAKATTAPDLTRPAPLFGYSIDGFFLGTKDVFQVRLRALIQGDARAYFDTAATPLPDQFVIRRARPIIEGTVANFVDFRLVPDFGLGNAVVQDAYVDIRPWAWLALRGGKFKAPFGLERLQHDAMLAFMERGLPSDLVPDRDIGASLHGDIGGGSLLYEAAVMNGAPDGSNVDGDTNDGKDGVFRVFSHPLRFLRKGVVKNLGIGFAATYGKQHGTATATGLASYRTTGQNVFFSYLFDPTGVRPTVIAISDRYRLTPQLYWYAGPVGLLAEYVWSATTVTNNLGTTQPRAIIENQAWQVEVQVVLTGEQATYNGVRPKRPFSLKQRHFGAVELAARYGELRIDAEAFPTYADPTRSARAALDWGVGVNWYLHDAVKIVANFDRTTFKGGAGMGDRRPENALFGRLQLYF
jgi:phosphate-selective porin OprO and OprP